MLEIKTKVKDKQTTVINTQSDVHRKPNYQLFNRTYILFTKLAMVLYLQLQLSALAFEPLLIAFEAKTTLHATFLIWRLYIYDSMFPNESTFWFSKCKVVYLHNVLP